MEVTAAMVKELREKTGVGMMQCKAALAQAAGDLAEAEKILRKQGVAAAAKKSGRATGEGLVASYIHTGGKIGVQVEFANVPAGVATRPEFTTFVKEVAMQIAAASPLYVTRTAVPADVLEKERAIYRAQMEQSGKPPAVIEKIVEGKLGSFYAQVVLVDQASIRDPKMTVADVVNAAAKALGTPITVTRFARLKIGEAA
jgi:elongation factor Ts